MRLFLLSIVIAVTLVAGGCASLRYYAQSVSGQVDVLSRREPIRAVIEDPDTDPALAQRLRLALEVRDFASREMALPDNGSYRTYADVGRPYVVWNVFAAPGFSLEPETWCFPFVGCVAYRGYFEKADAQAFGSTLREQGLDVYVAGVPAYSTLGWFDDPVLNTMVHWPEAQRSGLIFHELAHQVVYIRDDSAFNESFAVTVEKEGVRRWMSGHGNGRQYRDYLAGKRRQRQFIDLVMDARARLEKLYSAGHPAARMRAAKAEIFADMRERYRQLRQEWGGDTAYDQWMETELNNAKIASVATYHKYVPAFDALLKRHGGNMATFYAQVERLSELPAAERHARLQALVRDEERS